MNTNLSAVNAISPEYFEYLVELHAGSLSEDAISTRAAIAVRSAYAHALETVFAVTFAGLQAPEAIYAWLHRYRTEDVVALVRRIHEGVEFHHAWLTEISSWNDVTHLVLSKMPNELVSSDGIHVRKDDVADNYAHTLNWFATDMLSDSFRDEYNDAKHGLRLLAGGFTLAFSEEDDEGKAAGALHTLCHEKFGTSAYRVEQLPAARHHLQVVQHSRNWRPKSDIQKLHLATCWLTCVKSWLRVALGETDPPPKWDWIADPESYQAPWKDAPAVPHLTWRVGKFDLKSPMTREEIVAIFEEKKRRRDLIGARSREHQRGDE
jgi:hypothetical protein